jgi:hypothetical protein
MLPMKVSRFSCCIGAKITVSKTSNRSTNWARIWETATAINILSHPSQISVKKTNYRSLGLARLWEAATAKNMMTHLSQITVNKDKIQKMLNHLSQISVNKNTSKTKEKQV